MVPLLLLLLAWTGGAAAAPAQVLPISPSSSWQLEMGSHVSREESAQLREEVREMVRPPCSTRLVAPHARAR